MNTKQSIWPAMAQLVSCLVTAYKSDLEYDEKAIAANPGIPFLHWTRANGTSLDFHPAADDPCWPAKGDEVPYLFSTAGRQHILNQKVEMAKYWARPNTEAKLCVWFDGEKLHKVSMDRAVEIAREYRARIERAWSN